MLYISCILFVLAGLAILVNWGVLLAWILKGRRGSMLLLVAGGLGILACAVHPTIGWRWGLLFLIADPGCFGFVNAVPRLADRVRNRRT